MLAGTGSHSRAVRLIDEAFCAGLPAGAESGFDVGEFLLARPMLVPTLAACC